MKQKFIFTVEVYPLVKRRLLCVEQLVPDYNNGVKEDVVITACDFFEAAAQLRERFSKYINRISVRSAFHNGRPYLSEVIK